MDFLLKEAERLCKKQKTFREAQLGKVDDLQRRVDEARTELEGIGASLCCHPQLPPPCQCSIPFCSILLESRNTSMETGKHPSEGVGD
jgi:hypothetical protein